MKSKFLLKITSVSRHAFLIMIAMTMGMHMIAATGVKGQSLSEVSVTLNTETSVFESLKKIEKQTVFKFGYNKELPELREKVVLNFEREPLRNVLVHLAKETGIRFKRINKLISITSKADQPSDEVIESSEQRVTGKVLDGDSDLGLPGVTVRVKYYEDIGTITDANGDFTINVPDEAKILLITSVGYVSQEVAINGRAQLTVRLLPDQTILDDVVVVGYGAQKRADITGAITSLNIEETDKTAFTSTEQLLQGRVAGLQLSNVSGNPGGQQRVNIRGVGSLQGDNQPLYVIDGIPVSNTDPSETPRAKFGQGNLTNPLSLLNPNDIESVEVLKDAASAAIYGSRGTNGVILITTKKGRSGKANISVSAYGGVQLMGNKIDVAGTEEYLKIVNEARTNFNRQKNLKPGQTGFLEPILDPREAGGQDTDWIGLITRNAAKISDVSMSFSNGNENTRVYVSAGYFDQEGLIKTSRFQRFSTNFNIETNLSKSIKVGNNLLGSYSVNNRVASHGGISLLSDTREQRPFDTPFDKEGKYNVGGSSALLRNNGVRGINESDSEYKSYRIINNTFLEYQTPLKGLIYRPSVGIDFALFHDRLFWSPDFRYAVGDGGQLTDSRNIALKTVINNQLSYTGKIDKLNYTVTAIHAFERFKLDRTFIEATGFPFKSNGSLSSATNVRTSTFRTPPSVGNAVGSNAIESYIGRVSLNYNDRYYLKLVARQDGSSQFAKGKKQGIFPSVSVGWRLSDEAFFPSLRFVDDVKLRFSWGKTGSVSGLSDFASLGLVSGGFSYNGQKGALVTQRSNDLLTWESSTQSDVGIDLALFSNRIQLGIDYFNRLTSDLLFNRPVVATSGFTSLTQNIGSIRNKGIEIELSAKLFSDRQFQWDMDLNFSSIKNEVVSLPDGNDIPVGFAHILRERQAIGSFFLLRQVGIYQNDKEVPEALFRKGVRAGDIIYEDVNNDGDITGDDRQIAGSALPDFYGGLTNSFKFGQFDLLVFSTYSFGNKVYANYRRHLDNFSNQFNKRTEAINTRWTGVGTSNTTPRAVANMPHNNQSSTRFLEDGSFFRVKTITAGYTFPQKESSPFSLLRVYATVLNPFLFTGYSGLDPETSDSLNNSNFGIDQRSPPPLRTFTLGFNINF